MYICIGIKHNFARNHALVLYFITLKSVCLGAFFVKLSLEHYIIMYRTFHCKIQCKSFIFQVKMVKSRSEICKYYRNRLKEKGDDTYLRKERERHRKNYVPAGVLNSAERVVRRDKVREAVKRYHEKKKRIAQERDRTVQSGSYKHKCRWVS